MKAKGTYSAAGLKEVPVDGAGETLGDTAAGAPIAIAIPCPRSVVKVMEGNREDGACSGVVDGIENKHRRCTHGCQSRK